MYFDRDMGELESKNRDFSVLQKFASAAPVRRAYPACLQRWNKSRMNLPAACRGEIHCFTVEFEIKVLAKVFFQRAPLLAASVQSDRKHKLFDV
jgi:hypothetical protein